MIRRNAISRKGITCVKRYINVIFLKNAFYFFQINLSITSEIYSPGYLVLDNRKYFQAKRHPYADADPDEPDFSIHHSIYVV